MPLTLALLVGAALRIGVASTDDATAERAIGELEGARTCDVSRACIEDVRCATRELVRCDVDAFVWIEERAERDGRWVSSVVVDGTGTVAFALEEPAGRTLLSPAVRASVAALVPVISAPAEPPAARPETRAPTAPLTPASTSRASTASTTHAPTTTPATRGLAEEASSDDVALWIGAVGASIGVAVAVAAGALALANESVLASQTSAGDEKTAAQGTARAAWVGSAAGLVLAGIGVVVLVSDGSDG